MPRAILIMIGFVMIPFRDFSRDSLSKPFASGPVKDRISTAAILYRGTVPTIIKGAMPEFP